MSEENIPPVIDAEQKEFFEENGFLAIDQLVPPDDLLPIENEYADLLDRLAHRLFAEGKVSSRYDGLAFGDRYGRLVGEFPDLHRFFNISLPLLNGGIDPDTFRMHSGPAVFGLLCHPRILDVVEAFIGPEISSSPVQQMRMKPPEKDLRSEVSGHSNIGATTWHQDIVALLPEADDTAQLTVWLAITEATIENGCLASIPGSHRDGGRVHCANAKLASEPHVPEHTLQGRDPVPLPVGKGGVVLFHKMNVHRAYPNRSNGLRWSMDLRYHPTGQASGRPAFPGFVARSRANLDEVLRDPSEWSRSWGRARDDILSGRYRGRLFEDTRWADVAVC
ncbi:phytanoyl-CoA dioxygenase family protein [Hwanghaeella sp.]|uniref:phytanoyl-CoA dioxygenase family protein n=1 Tax=Hwanghaeella sp. TaxID=2605943 RepID=UPI003CCB8F9F